jgi:hypothetical protein
MCHSFVPSNTDYARPFRCPTRVIHRVPSPRHRPTPNNVECTTLPDMSDSSDMLTLNPMVDPTYPTDLLEGALEPKFDAQDQLLGTSSSFLSSIHLDKLLEIWVRLPG